MGWFEVWVYTFFVIGVLLSAVFTPVVMHKGVYKLLGNESSNTTVRYIPVLNVIDAEKEYLGRGFIFYSTIACVISFILRIIVLTLLYQSAIVQLISVVLLMLTIALNCIANILFVYTVINDTAVLSIVKTIAFAIAYPVGQYFIGTLLIKLVNYEKKRSKEAGVFECLDS